MSTPAPEHSTAKPDPIARLARIWRGYAQSVYGPDYPLYQALAGAVAEDTSLLAMILECRTEAHDPNMLLAAVQFMHIIDFMIIMPLGPVYMREMRLTPQQFGHVVGAYTVAAGLAGLAASRVLDRFGQVDVLRTDRDGHSYPFVGAFPINRSVGSQITRCLC